MFPTLLAEPSGMENFWLILSKPDNIPILIMMALFGFFTWYSLKMGRDNDQLIEKGERDEVLRRMQD